jgi:hypothetical protein
VSEATIHSWLKQDRIDRGEAKGATTTGQQRELAAAKRRRRQQQTELAVVRKVNEVFLSVGLLRLEGPSGRTEDAAADLAGRGDHRHP